LVVASTFTIEPLNPTVPARESEVFANEVTAMSMPRVFLADDQEEIRETVALVLDGEFQVVGTAADGRRALELAPKVAADVLVLDISMPGMNGIEVASHLREEGSSAKVVFLTIHDDPDLVDAAMSTGALGYVLKGLLATDLVPAIWKAIEGRTFISHSLPVG
jgi:DNA-binding NarL/FixJ family response regulator